MIVPTNSERVIKMRESLINMTNRAIKAELENEKLRALLSEARDDIRCDIENRYPPEMRHYPSEMRRYKREMDFVYRIEEVLENNHER